MARIRIFPCETRALARASITLEQTGPFFPKWRFGSVVNFFGRDRHVISGTMISLKSTESEQNCSFEFYPHLIKRAKQDGYGLGKKAWKWECRNVGRGIYTANSR